MPKEKRMHLTEENRQVIEAGIIGGVSCRTIAKRIDVSASTVSREVKANRTIKEKKRRPGERLSNRCENQTGCDHAGSACISCATKLTTCKLCRTKSCIDSCSDFKLKMCPKTQRWPYICPPECPRKRGCSFPKCSYSSAVAQKHYEKRLSDIRSGIDIADKELSSMNEIVTPLLKQGQSLEAIWCTHADELPVSVRTAYSYLDRGLLGISALEFPRKTRLKPRKKKACFQGRERVDREGRTYKDFLMLPIELRSRVVQTDSVEGFQYNVHDLLSLKIVALEPQFYFLKVKADPAAVVGWLDAIEGTLGSPDAFEAIFPVLLCDRGIEFDDWAGMERSYLVRGARRCRVFYCDAMQSNQKSQAERTHERLRRILPKTRSDFDELSNWDVATITSHVNSYPLASRDGKCPLELAQALLPQRLLEELGVVRLHPDEVILKPNLITHAVRQ